MEITTCPHAQSNHAVCVTKSPSHIWEKHHRAHRTGGAGLMAVPKHLSRPRATQTTGMPPTQMMPKCHTQRTQNIVKPKGVQRTQRSEESEKMNDPTRFHTEMKMKTRNAPRIQAHII